MNKVLEKIWTDFSKKEIVLKENYLRRLIDKRKISKEKSKNTNNDFRIQTLYPMIFKERSIKLRVKMRRKTLYLSKRLNSLKEPFKTIKRKKMSTLVNLKKKRKAPATSVGSYNSQGVRAGIHNSNDQ